MQAAKEEAEKYIESLALSQEESKIVNAMNGLMQIYSQKSLETIEKRMENFESGILPYFEKMIADHLLAVEKGLNDFLEITAKDHVPPKEIKASMDALMEIVRSPSVEEMKAFSSVELKQLHDSVVVPLKAHVEEGINFLNRERGESHNTIMRQIHIAGEQILDNIMIARHDIKDSIGAVRSKLEGMNIPRTLQ